MDPKYDQFLKWRTLGLKDEDGIVVGADISQEWLLPWWWSNYKKHNTHPVAFVDFGMSFEMKDWCKERGEWIPLRIFDDYVAERAEVDPRFVAFWESDLGKSFWSSRSAWFKKPLACLQSPFRRSVWIDLDCEIRKPITPLFDYADQEPGVAMIKDFVSLLSNFKYPMYNSGVIPFRRAAPLLVYWAQSCIERNGNFKGDQEVFSEIIGENKISISEIPPAYNWSRIREETGEEAILHWHGVHGKTVIKIQMNLSLSERV